MTTTYTGALTVPFQRVRFEISDRGPDSAYVASGGTAFRLTDEEILAVLSTYSVTAITDDDFWLACAACAEAIAGLYAASVNVSNMGLAISASSLSAQYYALADRLRNRDALDGQQYATFFVGGQTRTEREQMLQNTELIQPGIVPGMDDNPMASGVVTDPLLLRGRGGA